MKGIRQRIEDAFLLWESHLQESAFLLVLVAVASLSKLGYPGMRDGEAFKTIVGDFHTLKTGVEFRNKLQPIEQIFYKWIRCFLVHESIIPSNIQFQEDNDDGSMSVRAGGAPEFTLKIGTGWFFHFAESVLTSEELKTPANKG